MKKYTFTFLVSCLLTGLGFYGCSKYDDNVEPFIINTDQVGLTNPSLFGANRDDQTISIPLKAKFSTSAADDAFTQICGDGFNSPSDFWGLDHQIGEGNATHLGQFTFDMNFCFHIILTEGGQPDWENGFGKALNGAGVMTAANGDQLYFSMPEGQVVPIVDPKYGAEFSDEFFITGGTGRFVGATGKGEALGRVILRGVTDHYWIATLTLPK